MSQSKTSKQVLTSNSEVLNRSKIGIKLMVRAAIHKFTFDYKFWEQTGEYVVIRAGDRSLTHNIYMALKRQGVVSQYKKGKHSGAWFLKVIL